MGVGGGGKGGIEEDGGRRKGEPLDEELVLQGRGTGMRGSYM